MDTSSYIPPIRTNIPYPNDTQRAFDAQSHFARPILKVIGDTSIKVLGDGAGIGTSVPLVPAGEIPQEFPSRLGLAINIILCCAFVIFITHLLIPT